MSDEPPRSRLDTARQFVRQIGRSEPSSVVALLSPDVTYRVPGDHVLAGIFHGPREVANHLSGLARRTGNTYDQLKLEDWLVGEYHVAALVDFGAHAHGASVKSRLLVMLGFDEADRISEIEVFFHDGAPIERFFGR